MAAKKQVVLPGGITGAISLRHSKETDQGLDTGGPNEVLASDIKNTITNGILSVPPEGMKKVKNIYVDGNGKLAIEYEL